MWALLSSFYSDETNKHSNMTSIYRQHLGKLNFKGIDFPTSIDKIVKVEKQSDIPINEHGCSVPEKNQNVSTFPYHISEQPNSLQRINLLLVTE